MSRKARDPQALVGAIEEITGLRVADAELLRRALTHASASGAVARDYQRLEFLGDRVLALVVAELVYAANPQASEGELSLRLNALVNAETLAELADEMGLTDLIATSGVVRDRAGRKNVNLRADVTEALIAVLYLEGGLEAVRHFIRRYWEPRSKTPQAARRDAKTELQEWAHQFHRAAPLYSVDSRTGPDHDPVFEVLVSIDGAELGRGTGRSKREAEQTAARAILVREGVWREGDGA